MLYSPHKKEHNALNNIAKTINRSVLTINYELRRNTAKLTSQDS